MNTPTVITPTGRIDVHRLNELYAPGADAAPVVVDASGIEFLDHHALDAIGASGAVVAAPSGVVRITLELTGSAVPCFASVDNAIASLARAA